MSLHPGSRARLTPRALPRFPRDTLFDKVARAVCRADCLPRKELYEAWEVARRTRRRFRGGRVVDLASGHGLLARLMMLLDDSSRTALAVDTRLPASATKIASAMIEEWPRLRNRVSLQAMKACDVPLFADDVVVSSHACGPLTDEILGRAISARARLAVLPCCQDKARGDRGGLDGWMDAALAIDTTRAARLAAHGYVVYTQTIPAAITPKNRLLLAEPA